SHCSSTSQAFRGRVLNRTTILHGPTFALISYDVGIEDLFVVSVETDFGRTMERVSVCLICEQQISERNSIGGESGTGAPSFGQPQRDCGRRRSARRRQSMVGRQGPQPLRQSWGSGR